jgi:predicted 3-demethylubiquinone-9 3-methyltransferase (glyoxalase superfamily)
MAKNTICLWYDKDAEAAARFYAATFPDSMVGAVHRAPSDYPAGKAGDVLTAEFSTRRDCNQQLHRTTVTLVTPTV